MADWPTGTVTILFTDIVGSTALRNRLGDTAADDVWREHDRAVIDAIERADGVVVKRTGDGVMAAFTGSADTLRGAVACQQAVGALAPSSGERLEIRVGVAVGDVAHEGDDYAGLPVVAAARLCDRARAGEILATELVAQLAGTRAPTTFGERVVLELKGLDPCAARSVAWEPLVARDRPPMPTLARSDDELAFHGRGLERSAIADAWKAARNGERRAVFVSGEPGVGKSRLCSEAATVAHADGALVLVGTCDRDLGIPYQPFVEILRQYVNGVDAAVAARAMGPWTDALARLLPELSSREAGPTASDGAAEPHVVVGAYVALVRAIAADHPVVLVLDDIQWASRSTLQVLKSLLRIGDRFPLLVLATYRDSEVDRRHPLTELLGDLGQRGAATRLPLGGLDPGTIAELLGDQGTVDDGLAERIADQTEGNALFVVEVIRDLAAGSAASTIPEGVRDAVTRRMAALSPQAEQLLQGQAIAGPEASLDRAAAAAALTVDDAEDSVDELCAARLLREVADRPGRYRFPHLIVRSAVYGDLTSSQRRRGHRRIKEHLEAQHPDPTPVVTELAHHGCEASSPGSSPDDAVRYCELAAVQARASGAVLEAATWYERALSVLGDLGDPARKLELSMAAAVAHNDGMQYSSGIPHFQRAFELAEDLGDVPMQIRSALEAGGLAATWFGGSIEGPTRRLEQIRRFATDDAGLDALILASLSNWCAIADPRRSADSAAAAIEILPAADPATALGIRMMLIQSFMVPDHFGGAFANLDALDELVERAGDPEAVAWAHNWRAVFTFVGCRAAAHRDAMTDLRADIATGNTTLRYCIDAWDAMSLLAHGRVAEFRRAADQAVLAVELAGPRMVHVGTTVLCAAATGHDIAGAHALAAASRDDSAADRTFAIWHAFAETLAGRTDEAERLLDAFARQPVSRPLRADVTMHIDPLVSLAVRCHHRPALVQLGELLRPYARLMTGSLWQWSGSFSYELGRVARALGHLDDAEVQLSDALAVHRAFDAPLLVAQTHLELGRVHAERDDSAQAAEHRGHAASLAQRLGFLRLAAEASA